MSEEGPSWMQIPSSSLSIENILETHPAGATQDTGKKKTPKEARQLLSCTRCRERKVKCDRTKPCSSCCARGVPKECHFVIAEGSTYEPILQSYEIRKLRAEILRLKERLRAGKYVVDDDQQEPTSPTQAERPGARAKRAVVKQKRFKDTNTENIYFGSPALASIVSDFASLQVGSQSLSYSMPRGADMYASQTSQNTPAYPFATMWPATLEACIPQLLGILPPKKELMEYLGAFQSRAQSCSFPHVPEEITSTEIERFLADAQNNAEMFPDMLALLFAALAQGSQNGVFDKSGGKWEAGAMEAQQQKVGDVYIAAAMQALRMASFMNRPTLLGIQTLIMIGPYLTNSGRFLDAWTLFGTTIRLAHSIGLHRNPKYLDPVPPHRECTIRQTLWWWMLHMDQQYSMTLGRPLGISGIGDCPPAKPLTTNQTIVRLSEYIDQFTVLARQILSSDRLTVTKIDYFTDMLTALWDTMPEMLQIDETWLEEGKQIPEWPLDAMAAVLYGKTQNYLILLNRQRIAPDKPRSEASQSPPPPINQPSKDSDTRFNPINTPSSQPTPSVRARMPPPAVPLRASSRNTANPPKHRPSKLDASERGRPLVLSSSVSLINAFLFFYYHVPAALICWTMGQQAFNSCMILILDALETGNLTHISHVERAYAVFVELDQLGVHKLAGLAKQRVSWGLVELGKRQRPGRESMGARAVGEASGSGSSGGKSSRARGDDTAEHGLLDTVMGNTGMLLLEDTGLQSFVPESFQPLGWDMAGHNLQQQQYNRPQPQPQQPAHQSPFYNPQPSGPLTPFRDSDTQQMGGSSSRGMGNMQMPTYDPQDLQQQTHYTHQPTPPLYQPPPSPRYQPSASPQNQPHPYPQYYPQPSLYESQPRGQPRSFVPYPPHSASFQSAPHYGPRNPDAMDLGGNPGWAARPAPEADQQPGQGRSRDGFSRGSGSGLSR